MDFSHLKINCKRIARIFANNRQHISDKEEKRLNDLLLKERLGKLTEVEIARADVLQEKKEQSAPHLVSKAAQMYLLYIYLVKKYGGYPKLMSTGGDIPSSAANGNLKEPYAIKLLKDVAGIEVFRNKFKLKNDFLHGIVDAFDDPDWQLSKKVHEIKTTSDRDKFLYRKRYPLTKEHFLQVQGYLAITDKDRADLHFCLVDYHEEEIYNQRLILFDYLCPDGHETDTFREEWNKKERLLRHLDFPNHERIFTVPVDRDDEVIQKIYKKVKDCRKWLMEFDASENARSPYQIVQPNKIRI